MVGDPTRLREGLINLVGNAAKFTVAGSAHVEVGRGESGLASAQDQASLIFRVTDTGIGISEEDQKHIFEAFAQADSGVTRRFGGTGLGLAICSQLAQLMGGHLSMESTPHVGSTFQFACSFAIGKERDLPMRAVALVEPAVPVRIL